MKDGRGEPLLDEEPKEIEAGKENVEETCLAGRGFPSVGGEVVPLLQSDSSEERLEKTGTCP